MSDIERVKEALQALPWVVLAAVFGSAARGAQRVDSDIDVAVEAEAPLTLEQKSHLIDIIADAVGRPVDLVDLTCAGQPLLGQIISGGRQIVGSRDAWARWVYRNIMDNEDFVPLQRRMLEARRAAWIGK